MFDDTYSQPTNFTSGWRMPVSIVSRYKDGVWAIDSGEDDGDDGDRNVLTWVVSRTGAFIPLHPHARYEVRKFLTAPEPEFKTLLPSSSALAEGEEDKRRHIGMPRCISDVYVMWCD